MIRTEAAPCFSSPEDSFDGALTPEQELELADLIQCGQVAQAELEDLEAQAEELGQSNELTAASDKLRARVQAGKRAEHRPIEMNLFLSSDLARISVGRDPQTAVDTNKLSNLQRLSELSSCRADEEARIQVAHLGLVQAAQDYSRDITDREGNPLRFSTYAIEVITAALIHYVAEHEGPAYFPSDALREIINKLAHHKSLSALQQKKLHQFSTLHDPLSLDALYLETKDGNEHGTKLVADMIPDPKSKRMLYRVDLHQTIESALATNLSEREALFLRQRYGLQSSKEDDQENVAVERDQKDIAIENKISRQRVSEIEQYALRKLRNADSPEFNVLIELWLTEEGPEPSPIYSRDAAESLERRRLALGQKSLRFFSSESEDMKLSS